VLGPSEGGLGGQDAPDAFPASGRNAYLSRDNPFFADGSEAQILFPVREAPTCHQSTL